jgi:acyl-CoA synthetase (AMP-forming)/AMP-acid ligase II
MTNGEGLTARFAAHAADHGGAVAFRFLGRQLQVVSELTWGELWHQGCAGALHLSRADLRGRRIGLLCPNGPDFVLALAAVLLAGGTAVPMPATLGRRSASRTRFIREAADLSAIIAPQSVAYSESTTTDASKHVEWITSESLHQDGRSAIDLSEICFEPSAPLILQFTSGSTDLPKGVLLSHANVIANCSAIAGTYDLDDASVGVSWLPLHHDMGLVGHVLLPLWSGGRSVIMDPLRFVQQPLSWLQAISAEQATITSAPNFAYELCSRAAPGASDAGLELSSLTTAICGGEPVVPETIEAFVRRFGRHGFRRAAFAPSYGLAEATLLVASGKSCEGPSFVEAPSDRAAGASRPRYTTVGRPVPGVRLRIVDPENGTQLPNDRIGEIEVAGSSVGTPVGGVIDEWIRTGDLGFLHRGGLCVTGRSKELLILRGENVFPADVEAAALGASPLICPGGVAAIGVDRDGTQAMILIVELRSSRAGGQPRAELRRAICERVAGITGHVPDEIVLVNGRVLPRTTSGKLQRAEIQALVSTGQVHALADAIGNPSEAAPAHA